MKLPSDITDKSEKKKSLAYKILKACGFLLGLFLIYWFVSQSPLTGIVDQLKKINIYFIFPLAVTFSAYLMVTIAWRLSFLNSPGHLSVSYLFFIRQIGESLAQVNPTNVIAGEALKAVLLKRKGVNYKDSIVSLTISRFIIILSAVSLILIGVYLFFDTLKLNRGQFSLIVTICIIFILLIVLIILLQTGKGISPLPMRILGILGRKKPESERIKSMIKKLQEVDEELIEFYQTKKTNFITAYILSFLHWVTGAVEFYLILYFLGYQAPFFSCIAMEVGVMVFKAMAAFVPGQVGIEEYANKMMLELVNISVPDLWITVSILRRARQLFWICVGFIAFLFVMRKTKEYKDGSIVYNS